MAGRSIWNGHIRLSLVTFPVHLYAAVTESEKVRLHKVDRESGKRIHYQNVTDDREVVEAEDIARGYEYEKGHYILVEDEELDALRAESSHMIDLVQFTELKNIDAIYFDKPYFIAPDGKVAAEAFVTLRDSLRQSGKAALGQITISGKERISVIKPCGKGLVLETLRYDYEVRRASEYFADIPETVKVSKDQVDLAAQLIESKTGTFNPREFKDRYQEALLEIIQAKMNHQKIPRAPKEKAPSQVINIIDALKKSLEQAEKTKPNAAKKSGRSTTDKAAIKKTPAKKTAGKKKKAA